METDYLETYMKFYYQGKDALEQIKIIDSNFKIINLEFPDPKIAPYIEYYPTGYEMFDFQGTRSLLITGNNTLTDIDLKLRMVTDSNCYEDLTRNQYPPITIENNPILSSINLELNYRRDGWGNFDYGNIKPVINIKSNNIKNLNVVFNSLSQYVYTNVETPADYTLYKTYKTYKPIFIMSLDMSEQLESFNVNFYNTPVYENNTVQLSSIDGYSPIYFNNYLYASYSDYSYPISEYSSFYTLCADIPFNEENIDNFKIFNFSNLQSSTPLYQTYSNFITLNSTISELLTTARSDGNYPKVRQYLFSGDTIPVELMFDIFNNNEIYKQTPYGHVALKYPYIITNPNTLFAYQYNIMLGSLSGSRQPYTHYVMGNYLAGFNPDFKMNVNSDYTWPLSVIAQCNRYALNQGPFAGGPRPVTLIHPKYGITAWHWNRREYPYSTYFYDINSNTRILTTEIAEHQIGSTDISIIEFENALPLSSFPGLYILPHTLYQSNSATKIPKYIPSMTFSQDYDITPKMIALYSNAATASTYNFGDNIGAITSEKEMRSGDSGHPVITFINDKPVLLLTWLSAGGSNSISYNYNLIQAKIDELEGISTPLNVITQADLDAYEDSNIAY